MKSQYPTFESKYGAAAKPPPEEQAAPQDPMQASMAQLQSPWMVLNQPPAADEPMAPSPYQYKGK